MVPNSVTSIFKQGVLSISCSSTYNSTFRFYFTTMQCFIGTPVRAGSLTGGGSFAGMRAVAPQRPFVRAARRTPAPVRMGLIPLVPNWLLLGSYVFGAYRFFRGFRATDYQRMYRIPLSLLFPIFLIASATFRSNFSRAIRDDGGYSGY